MLDPRRKGDGRLGAVFFIPHDDDLGGAEFRRILFIHGRREVFKRARIPVFQRDGKRDRGIVDGKKREIISAAFVVARNIRQYEKVVFAGKLEFRSCAFDLFIRNVEGVCGKTRRRFFGIRRNFKQVGRYSNFARRRGDAG